MRTFMIGASLLAGVVYSLAWVTPTGAANIVDPDAFPNGTVLDHAFPGVTLSARDGLAPGSNSRSVTSQADVHASTGTQAFAHDQGDTAWGNGIFEFLRVDFGGLGASFVSIDFFANDTSDSNPQLLAFSSSDVLLDMDAAGLVALGSPVTLSVNAPNIAYVAAYWDEIRRSENGGLDNLQWLAVPEPATCSLLLAAVCWVVRRRA